MAINPPSIFRTPSEQPVAPVAPIDIEAWTVEQAAETLAATSFSVKLDIPLDIEHAIPDSDAAPRSKPEAVHTVHRRREPIRRDSLKRREALQKGKEGSRRRQRWENDRLLSNPYAQPPLPSDWEVRPTHPVRGVPYFLAPLWDAEYARAASEKNDAKSAGRVKGTPAEQAAAKVARELRANLKHARSAKGLLQDLEQEVRGFVAKWELKERQLEREGLLEPDSEDDEMVFVGRNGAMSDQRKQAQDEEDLRKDMMVFQGLVDDHGAAFARYLVHSIAQYYGLLTWSITTGDPARREAYVGLKQDPHTRRPSLGRTELPRPLWGLV